MKVGAIIICRYNSSRLPGKILKEINGKPILLQIYNRLKAIENLKVIIATSEEETDSPIVEYCKLMNLDFYRGSLSNVSYRFLNAAKTLDVDYAIRVNGDNLFISIETMKYMISLAQRNTYDFISNVKGRTFPFGMSIEILKVSFYDNILSHFDNDYYKEHVTIYLYENENCGSMFFVYNNKIPKAKGLKIAIDTKEDFERALEISKKINFKNYDLKEIVEAYE